MKEQKIIFFDIDNTLLPHSTPKLEGKVPKSAIDALKLAKASGFKLAIATGRARFMMNETLEQIGIEFDYLIGTNGQASIESINGVEKVIWEDYFSESQIETLINWAKKNNLHLAFQSIYNGASHNDLTTENMKKIFKTVNVEKLPLNENFHKEEKVHQALIFGEEDQIKECDIPGIKVLAWNIYGGDLMKEEANKARGITETINYHNRTYPNNQITSESIYCFGDGMNDLEMFKKIKNSFVMGNASNLVKELAFKANENVRITTDIHEHGIANGISKILESLQYDNFPKS